jgi:hypothetical protein
MVPIGYYAIRPEWSKFQSEVTLKITKLPQPEHGFTKPLFAHTAAQAVPFLDCRTCAHFTPKACGCMSVVQCVNGDRFVATRPHQYWEAAPEGKK